MKDNLKDWFASLPAVPGMLACGVRRSNGKCSTNGDEKKYPPEKIVGLLNHFAGLHEPLTVAELPSHCTSWAFEHARLRFVSRPDKWLLALLVAPETEAEKLLDQLSGEFLNIPLK
jgi:hypothetical protein